MGQPRDFEGSTFNISDLVRDEHAVENTVSLFSVQLDKATPQEYKALVSIMRTFIKEMRDVGKLQQMDERFHVLYTFSKNRLNMELLPYVSYHITRTKGHYFY